MIIKFLFIILFFILLVMVIGFNIIRSVFRAFLGNNRNSGYRQTSNDQEKRRQQQWYDTEQKKKLFSKDEGEYIDFVEIKEEKK